MEKIRWGILSTGHIAHQFTEGLATQADAEIVAVGSRSAESAQAFASKFGIPHAHASYEALARDPQVDVIYIATPHNYHYANAMLCLNEGKPILVEKAFTLNAPQAAKLIALARQKNLFLMEAMWNRFLPSMIKLRELLKQGAVGEVRMVTADLGFRAEYNPEGRMLNPHLAGGAFLDVGCYVVSFASMLLGEPNRVTGLSHLGDTGVDEQSAIVLGYPEGRLAVLTCSVRTATPRNGYVFGTEGWIHLPGTFAWTEKLELKPAGGKEKVFRAPIKGSAGKGSGLAYEAREVMACLREGRVESLTMPLDESLTIMRTLDELRRQAGLRFPEEVAGTDLAV